MASTNLKTRKPKITTHEGGRAVRIGAEAELRRSVMACMLFEKEFYEDGVEISTRIASLIRDIHPDTVASIAIEAREKSKLRHVPLFIVREMARSGYVQKWKTATPNLVSTTLTRIIQRPDEITEFVALYWKDKKQPLSKQVKIGLRNAFNKFNEYQLAKNNKDKDITLKDIAFLVHAKPSIVGLDYEIVSVKDKTSEGGEKSVKRYKNTLIDKLVDDTLAIPDTWETILSGAKDNGISKAEAWEKIIDVWTEGGKANNHMAILRNLRNIQEVGVSTNHMRKLKEAFGHKSWATTKVLPFRFIAASNYAPKLEPELEKAMLKSLEGSEKLSGKTVVLVDVSGSMDGSISSKSDLRRIDAACGLAMLVREISDDVEIYTFSNSLVNVAPRRGFALKDLILNSQSHDGTELGKAVTALNKNVDYDRLIVITDEQSADRVPDSTGRGYVINVASNRNGVGYGSWLHIDGWSEAVIDYIKEFEKETI